ncbi:MAG: tRNA (adenosine(37)-N6)-threonylcarbamoyltransferase complex dimerization subunit type 1 TsaB [Candidatus Fermentibacteraceae bacterium]|nr:tRNA (adenosine(37)-N6)-threonylcarbamoyltransferase complex dimerization subunit type 1 TsaB [Candidatus Fermentibacteraceae bacterium]MBN2608430.1 tRNA (adenosine(37)-N6)-threonylcarbamoyltransferase complex dimerization subunit type 1 TsaB [Candidatus Fermentibacteraceae bacterium]
MAGLWLGIETTSPTGGIALTRNGEVLAEEFFPVMATHSENLLPGIARMLERGRTSGEDIAGIAVSAGPGSYTGVRIGISTAQGLAKGWNTGVVAVGTLRVLAVSVGSPQPVLACIRAREGEVFAAVYSSGSPEAAVIVEPAVYTAEALFRRVSEFGGVTAVGSGQRVISLPQGVSGTDESMDLPRPSIAAILGSLRFEKGGFDPFPVPLYLRDFNQKASTFVP